MRKRERIKALNHKTDFDESELNVVICDMISVLHLEIFNSGVPDNAGKATPSMPGFHDLT
jgi:hypothetical protein